MNPSYVFVFGRTPQLAFLELSSLFPTTTFTYLTDHAVKADNLPEFDPEKLMLVLGGTVTIGKIDSVLTEITPQIVAGEIFRISGESLKTFAFSSLGEEQISHSYLATVKDELSILGLSTRYIVNTKEFTLSAVVLKGQKVQEFIVVHTKEGILFCHTIGVQNIDEWVKREYDRPHADPKRGMLPPKVARMCVNIVSGRIPESQERSILDPFCGMGTVLAEGLVSKWNVYGSDIIPEVVTYANNNLLWVKKQYPECESFVSECVVSDAVHVSQNRAAESIDAIITEPFMGSPTLATRENVSIDDVKNTVRGLEKLYIGCLKDWKIVLKKHGVIFMAMPHFSVNGREFFVKKVIDSCETLGYSIEDGPYSYGRPGATVTRKFYLLKKI